MTLNEEQVKAAEKERLSVAAKERAELFLAQQDANAKRGWYLFLKAHSGQQAVNSSVVYAANEANNRLLEEAVKEMNEQVTEESLEAAWQKLTSEGRLAEHKPSKYVPQTVGKMFPDQKKNERGLWADSKVVPMPAVLVGISKKDVLGWSATKLRSMMRDSNHTNWINRILRGDV